MRINAYKGMPVNLPCEELLLLIMKDYSEAEEAKG